MFDTDKDFWKKLQDKANQSDTTATTETKRSITGLYGGGKQGIKTLPTRYQNIGNKLGWNPYATPEDMEREAYVNQSGTEVFMNTLKGFGTQALAGAIDSVAAYDMQGLYDMSTGNTEKKYGNWLNEIGKEVREYSEENHAIFQDGDSMWSAEYWAKQGQSLGYTGGIIAEAVAEQIALSYLTGGTANATALASKARLLKMGGQAAHGMWKGVQEGYMNGLETQQNVYAKYKELGYDEGTAQKKANEAATLGFRAEVGPLTALNALQFMTTFGVAKSAFNRGASGINGGFSGAAETLVNKLLPNVTNKTTAGALGFGINALSEGLEEGIQTGVGKYAQHETLKSTGDAKEDLNLWDHEMRDSVIGGIIGGGLFAGAGKILGKYTQGTTAKQYTAAHDRFITDATTRASNAFETQNQIQQEYNKALQDHKAKPSKANFTRLQEVTQKAKEAQYNMHLANTVNALQLDYITGKTTAYETHVEQMQTLLDAANKGDLETLKQYNILDENNKEKFEGSINTIKNTFEQNIKDSEIVRDSLENNLLNVTSDFQSAFDITKKEYINTKQLNDISEYTSGLETLYNKDTQFNQLSPESQRRFKLEAELESLNRLDKLSDANKERKIEISDELYELKGYKSRENAIVDSINKSSYVSAYASIASNYQAIDDNNKQLAKLRDPKNIEQNIKERKNTQIENAKTKEEVEETLAEAQEEGISTPEMETIAENKKSELAAEETIKEANPEFVSKPVVEKPLENSVSPVAQDTEGLDMLDSLLNSGALSSGNENFSPREFNAGNLSEEQITKLGEIYNGIANRLDKSLGKQTDFKDFINNQIEQFGYDRIEDSFEALKYAWDNIGRDTSNANDVYNQLFNSNELGLDILSAGLVTNEEVEQAIEDTIQDAITQESKVVTYNKDNRPLDKESDYTIKDGRTAIPTPKASFLGMQYREVKNLDGTFSKQPVLPQLNESEQIKNHYVLDSDMIKEGTELIVSIPTDVNNTKVAEWTFDDSENRWIKSEITFGEWARKNGATPGSVKYNNKVPMIASVGEDNIFFLHDTEWYNTTNVTGVDPVAQRENIKQGIANTRAVRESILAGNTTIKIDTRRFGSIFKVNNLDKNSELISLAEATGNNTLAIATTYTELEDSNSGHSGTLNSRVDLINRLDTKRLEPGVVYDIRQINTDKDGVKKYVALPTFSNNVANGELLNDTAYNNSKFSIIASVLLNSKNNPTILNTLESKYGMTLSKAQSIQESIKETAGLDIQFEIGDYLNMFTQVDMQTTRMIAKLEDSSTKETGELRFPTGMNYISVDNNVLKIINKDGSVINRNAKGLDTLPGINFNNITEAALPYITGLIDLNFNESNGGFRSTRFDVSKKQLGKNKKFTVINTDGSVSEYSGNKNSQNTYEGFVNDNLKTNIKSFPITDKAGKTKWVTDVQPMIYYSVKVGEEVKSEPVTTEEKAQQASLDAIEEIDSNIQAELDKVLEKLPEDKISKFSKFNRGNVSEELYSSRELTVLENESINTLVSNRIETLSPIEQKKLTKSLFNLVLSDTNITNGTVSLSDLVSRINSSLETYLQPVINDLQEYIGNLESANVDTLLPKINELKAEKDKLQSIIDNKEKIVSNGSKTPKGDLFVNFERFLAEELTTSEDIIEDENGEVEYSFNMSSLEKDVKLTFSNNLKIFFANIRKQNPRTREDILNYTYLNDFVDIDDVIQSLTEVMVGLPSSIDDLINVLETKKANPIYNQILNKIKSSSEEIQNEILYKMIQSKLDMNMVLYAYNAENKTYSLRIINPNSSSTDIKLKQQWQSDFINSDLFRTVNEERTYNKPVVQSLIDKIDKLTNENIDQTHKPQIKELFNSLGITVGDNTLERLIETDKSNIFSKKGILGVFRSNLKFILDSNKSVENITLEDSKNNPFENAQGVLSSLIDLELDLNGTRVSKSFRVGAKTIQGAVQKMMVYDIKESLKDTDSTLFRALEQIPYSKNNFILRMLKDVPKFKDNFDVSFISLESIKQVKQKIYDDRKINKLANTDNMLTQYAFFQNTLKELGEVVPDTNLEFRMAHMFNPALSDKEQMILYSTAVADLQFKNFLLKTDGTVELNDGVLDFVTKQIYDSEFDRIVNTYKNPTNIKNYDGAAKRFLSIPELNTIKSDKGASIHTTIAQSSHDDLALTNLKESFRIQAKDIIKETLRAELLNKVDINNNIGTWFESGFVTPGESGNVDINFFDTKYLARKKGKNTAISNKHLSQMVAYDFIVNQYLHQNNTYQLIAGDMALYAPSIKKFTNKDTKEVDNVAFSKTVGESISKRMAMLIAPGNKLANSKNDKYLQIFVNDPIKMTSTAREFIKQYYGNVSEVNNKYLERLANIENDIQNLYKSSRTSEKFDERLEELESSRNDVLKYLSEANEEIGGYFNIEGTDAQEYTTWKEHMDILFRQGRLSVDERNVLQTAYSKLEKGEDLSTTELAVVMNPIKPVYAGSNIFHDKEGVPNVNRIVYIKSSSFPLLPQLTKDFKLDKIRQQMEALQTRTNKNVRLSYQTANKVGALATKLTTNDLYNIPFEELYSSKLSNSILELDRDNFKIQQDTPYKTAKFLKKNSEDMTTMGSQMWKIILGNNINKMTEKVFPNIFGQDLVTAINNTLPEGEKKISSDSMLTGLDLDKIKFHSERMYFNIQKEMLYDELGIDKDTNMPVDNNTTIKLIHDLLKREVTTRQYPENVIDSLQLTEDDLGNIEFMLPIWLSTASNKFESLLQAIITNRLIQINLPGNQHISSSSEGFEKVAFEDLDSKIKSQVVWVNPAHTGELKTTIIDGKIKESEILVQSKFRTTYKDENGKLKTKLIDLSKAPYSRIENGVTVLNEGMIDDELLSMFSFRIPTSSHQSGAILKVVGFLPEANGDMLVVPKEHTQQIGEDFDIDKRTVYKSNYEIQEDGSIRKLGYSETNNKREKLTYALLGVDYEEYLGTEEGKTKRASLQAKTKMLENAMIDIYKSVYLSPSNEVQKKINKILSFDNATQTANLITNRINSTSNDQYFSIYSDDYQRQQMKLGADGKTGIGGHSNAVTFQAQMERLSNPIVIEESLDETGVLTPSKITIGKYTSNGVVGSIATLDGERNIGDVHTENQNSSTDNIKAQIMGKRNENPYTMNVLVQLTFRGFDMVPFTPRFEGQPDKVQVSSLFISQPILRRYVELKEQNKSITSDYDANSDANILEKLIQEFGSGLSIQLDEYNNYDGKNLLSADDYTKASSQMTGDRLYDNLVNERSIKTWESNIQIAVLQKFLRLTEEAKKLAEYQSLINLSTTGLGVSYFNVLDRVNIINKLGSEKYFTNIRDLVGDFIDKEGVYGNEVRELVNNGYSLIGNYYIKPTTTEGTVLVNSLVSGMSVMSNLYNSYTPNTPFGQAISSIISIKEIDSTLSKKSRLDTQYRIVSSMRDYIYSDNLNLFSGDINSERNRLFFDTKDNTSLASFLRDLKLTKRNPLMYTNELLKSFNLDGIKADGSPSIIKHQTDYNTNFDKTDKYNSFLELLQDDKTNLGTLNGTIVTPRKLAQDLATYAYLANNENGAIGFRDFINVQYLNVIGASTVVRNVDKGNISFSPLLFEQQFFQHNPEEAKIFSDSNTRIDDFLMVNPEANTERNKLTSSTGNISKNEFLNKLTEFTLKDNKYPYIAMRDTSLKKTDNQYKLFKFNGDKYIRIPVLGTFGFNEFNPQDINQKSVLYPKIGEDVYQDTSNIVIPETIDLSKSLDLSNGIISLMEQLYNDASDSNYKKFANELLPFIDTTTKIVISNDVVTGKYVKSNNTIHLGNNMINYIAEQYQEDALKVTEEILLEEIIHSITSNQLDKHGVLNSDGTFKPNEDAPVFVTKLVKLHELAKTKFPDEYYTKDIYEFMAGAFVSDEFKEKLDNSGLYKQFKDAIAAMIRYLTGSSYSDETVKAVYELLKYHNKLNTDTTSNNILKEMKKEDVIIDLEIGTDLDSLLSSGMFTSSGQEEFSSREFRLPEIKKC